MAWTAPMTFVTGQPLTAAQLNTHLRDNLLETAPAKSKNTASLFIGTGMNSITSRQVVSQRISTSQTTDATDEWVDLSTSGPAVTCETGTRAIVFIRCNMEHNTATRLARASFQITGATEREPLTMTEVSMDGISATSPVAWATMDMLTTLTPGESTFTMKYRVGSGVGTFKDRFIMVIPL